MLNSRTAAIIAVISLMFFAGLAQTARASVAEYAPKQPFDDFADGYQALPEFKTPTYNKKNTGIAIRDGSGLGDFYVAGKGLNTGEPLRFAVDGVDAPITRVEVLIALWHPHLNDLSCTLVGPDGATAVLFNNLSTKAAPIYISPDGKTYFGGIGFNEPIRLISNPDADEDIADMKRINDLSILNSDPTSKFYLNYIPPASYLAQGDLGVFIGKKGNGAVNGEWRIVLSDNESNNFTKDPVTGKYQKYNFEQLVRYVRLNIYNSGGYKIWTGGAGNDKWSDPKNWKDGKKPSHTEVNSIIFPSNADSFVAKNDIVPNADEPIVMRIADIDISGKPDSSANNYTITAHNANNVSLFSRAKIVSSSGDHKLELGITSIEFSGRIRSLVMSGALRLLNSDIKDKTTFGVTTITGIKKEGLGELHLGSANTFTGQVVIDEGILTVADVNALGSNNPNSYTLVQKNGTLRILSGISPITERLYISGKGYDGLGALHIQNANITVPLNVDWTNGAATQETISFGDSEAAIKIDENVTFTTNQIGRQVNSITNFHLVVNGANKANSVLAVTGLNQPTAITAVNATFRTAVDQPNLSNLILSNSIATGAGVLFPKGTGSFLPDKGAIHSTGISSVSSPINFGGQGREITVENGTLTVTSVLSNGTAVKRGAGTMELNSVNAVFPASIEQGTLSGNGTLGNVSVAKQGAINPTGVFNVASATFANEAAFVVDNTGDRLNSTGTVALGGVAGTGGAVLLAYQGVTGQIISGPNTGTFDGWRDTEGITYTPASQVVLGAPNGQLVWFNPAAYTAPESAGSLTVTAQWSGGVGSARLRNFGGTARRGLHINFDDGFGAISGTTSTYTIPILQNFVATGDATTTLALVPLNGARIATAPIAPGASTALLIITDDDAPDTRTCGFGTGLTVFFLMGCGWLVQLRLRRRG
jgi:autotransporter-associated beta strand protein